jgi:hypothetical protein
MIASSSSVVSTNSPSPISDKRMASCAAVSRRVWSSTGTGSARARVSLSTYHRSNARALIPAARRRAAFACFCCARLCCCRSRRVGAWRVVIWPMAQPSPAILLATLVVAAWDYQGLSNWAGPCSTCCSRGPCPTWSSIDTSVPR